MVVKPLNPSNAIESVSFRLEWQPPLSAHLLPVLAGEAADFPTEEVLRRGWPLLR